MYIQGNSSINSGALTQTEINLFGSSRLGVYNSVVNCTGINIVAPAQTVFTRGTKLFELSNHLGNVLVTVSDKKLQHTSDNNTVDYYTADVASASDYYPGGMNMPGRTFNSSEYRYCAANGQEKSTEINENSYTAEFWQYDARIVRRWNVDPKPKAYESPYAAFGNNPIWLSDVNGADTTLPAADGKNITLPTGATFETFQTSSKYTLPSNGKEVNTTAGSLKSFTIDGNTYKAVYNTETLAFAGYQDANGKSIVQENTFTPNFYDQWGHQGASYLSASLTYNSAMRVRLYLSPLEDARGLLDAGRITANEASLIRYTQTLRARNFLDPLGKALSGSLKSEAQALSQYQKFINTPGADAAKIFNTTDRKLFKNFRT